MILAAPLVIPFAKAVGLSVGTLGMAALADQVNEYIQANPEESMKILSTIIPGAGIGQIFMSKEDKISLEDLDEMTDEEAQDLTKEEKAELMKQAGKSGGKNKRQTMIDISEKLGLSGEGREKQDIEYDIDERYDEGGVEEVSKPKFDYTKFFRRRRADGGAIGVESLFEEKVPAAPSQLVEESEIILGYRGPGGYQGGRSSRSGPSQGPAGGASAGGNYGGNRNPSQTYGGSIFRGGGGGGGGQTTTSKPIKNPFSKKNLQTHFTNNQLLADAVKKGILTNKEYNILGGYDATQTLGMGPIDTGLASLGYNVVQSILGNQPFGDILGDVARNVKGATNISPELQTKYENIIGQNLADGGRVGFDLGGLTGPAKSIYDSMMAAGYFTEDEIRNAITGAGYEIPGASQPETTQPNIINQQLQTGGGDNFAGGIGAFGNLDPNTKKTMQVAVADGKGGVMIKEVDTYLDQGGMRKTLDNKNPVNLGLDVKPMAVGIIEALMGKKTDSEFLPEGKILGPLNNPNYKDLSFFGKLKADAARQKELRQLQKEFELQEKLKAQIAEEQKQAAFNQARADRDRAIASGLDQAIREGRDTSGFDRPSSGAYAEGAGMGVGGGYASDYGFAKGGLATMFKEKR